MAPWIFIDGTYIVDRGLIMLFFGLFFVAPNLGNFSADALGLTAVIALYSYDLIKPAPI